MLHRYGLRDLVGMIDWPNGTRCELILSVYSNLFTGTPGSIHNHQNWLGGYWDHITEVMNYADVLYNADPRPMPFTLSSALLVLFLHDIEKPWKYESGTSGEVKVKEILNNEFKSHAFRDEFIKEYGITLTPEEENALKYVHGEGNDYSSEKRVMGPLAAFCHICDVWVARIRFDCPMKKDDSWSGAERLVAR